MNGYNPSFLLLVLVLVLVLVQGNLFPIILFQFIFINKYRVVKIPAILRITAIMIAAGLSVFVNVEIMLSTNGLPKRTPIHTINSLYNSTPINTATANFCGLYFVRPNVM
jgi:hypothetical protein